MDHTLFVQVSKRTAYQVLNGCAVVVATRRRMVHRLDEVGTTLWGYLEPGRRVGELVTFLTDRYEVDPETAERDVEAFLGELQAHDLVEVSA